MRSLKIDNFEGMSDKEIFGHFFDYTYDDDYNRVSSISEEHEEFLRGAKILIAAYSYEDYSGNAFVLYEKDGKLYELHGSHCSCYGLEGQFSIDETTVDALLKRDYIYSYEWSNGYKQKRSPEDKIIAQFVRDLRGQYGEE